MTPPPVDSLVPDEVIPHGTLPPLRYRDLPPPIPVRAMMGPGIILAGLALGSGEFIFWPYLTYQSKFVFFWAAVLGVVTQFFLNLEITRWTLATGESAITGFIRLARPWAPVFLVLNIGPWMLPAWAKGAAQLLSWSLWGPILNDAGLIVGTHYLTELSVAGMLLCGIFLTAGPVVYETVEKSQMFLVSIIMIIVLFIAVWLGIRRPDAIATQIVSTVTLGAPQFIPALSETVTPMVLLGALAFAGAGGTMNLGQSNYIKDKGYGMGKYIGRITSPLTGKEEPIADLGFHFPHTEQNLQRWRQWWRSANLEHFCSFLVTCLVCLCLLTLISYVLFFDATGQPKAATKFSKDLDFVWGETLELQRLLGTWVKYAFLVAGIAILFTTEIGVLDAASRISTDIVKVAWLRQSPRWNEGRIYFFMLWGTIGLGSGLLIWEGVSGAQMGSFRLFKLTAAMNGLVMFLYSALLLYMNRRKLPPAIRLRGWRVVMIVWAILFFGAFSVWALWDGVSGLL